MEISGIPRLETLGIEPGTITKGSVVTGTGTNRIKWIPTRKPIPPINTYV